MVARKKPTTSSQAKAAQGPKSVKRATRLGNDLALTLPTSKGKSLDLSY
jgi:hypothetical protein